MSLRNIPGIKWLIGAVDKARSIDRAQAVIEFDLKGNILTANDNFLSAMHYTLSDIVGKHHSMFVSTEEKNSAEYGQFWERLRQGIFQSGEFKRVDKNGEDVWIQASYNPLLNSKGVPYKVVKFATVITPQKLRSADHEGQIGAISKSLAVIEFEMDGTILNANENFLNAMGYTAAEVVGKHHSIFLTPELKNSSDYQTFWQKLNRGEFQTGEFRRKAKGGKDIWIQASYNPILDLNGKPYKVVKYATDITRQKLQNADYEGQIDAISKSQAVIEFNMDGTIRTANENFLAAMGYKMDEVQGKHHKVFVEAGERNSAEYTAFWQRLNQGEFEAGEYKRLGKGGREVWIQASYNPIFDVNGKPFKVVKYATDITPQKLQTADYEGQINAIDKAQAVIEFNMDGTIRVANNNFLNAMGYTLDEIKGKHHSMFVTQEFKESDEYRQFWEKLNRGEFESAEYQRLGKGGKPVWIQASYNPILDWNGKPFKVVKYATDITERISAVKDISESLVALSQGDLTHQISHSLVGEFEELRLAMNSTLNKLDELVTNISSSSERVKNSSTELKQAASDLSQRTEAQASNLEETASSMEEMTSMVRQSASNAEEVNRLSQSTASKAEDGGLVVEQAVKAMKVIENSSQKISDIIGVIDEIAFQTNLLALNAAVEAARAGDQGRGFAVVAGEVRSLAQRSAVAAKEIKDLINDSVNKVSEGTKLVTESGNTLTGIVESIQNVSRIIADINTASQQQSTGINEVSAAIASIDEMTQQNAAMVEEASATTEIMSDEAQKLDSLIRYFKRA